MTLGNAQMQSVADLVGDARFQVTRLGSGYAMSQVDDLLDRIVRERTAGEVLAALGTASFRSTGFLEQGYAAEDVDDFLEVLRSTATG